MTDTEKSSEGVRRDPAQIVSAFRGGLARIGRDPIRLGAGLILLACILALISRYLDTAFKPIVLLALFVPLGAPIALLAAVACGYRGAWVMAVLAGFVAIAIFAPQIPILLARPAPAPAQDTLRVLTANLALGHADADQLVSLARRDRVDVLTVQELSDAEVADLSTAGIASVFPFSYLVPDSGGKGAGIYSKSKLVVPHTYNGFAQHELSAAVGLKSGAAVVVYSLHVWSLWRGSAEWRRETTKIARILTRQRGCVVAAGDYDASIDNAPLRSLMAGGRVHDAASDSGSLFSPTYRADAWYPALATIDHAMYRGVRAVSTSTHTIARGDHKALLATFDTSKCHTG